MNTNLYNKGLTLILAALLLLSSGACASTSTQASTEPQYAALSDSALSQVTVNCSNLDVSQMEVETPDTEQLVHVQMSYTASRKSGEEIAARFVEKVKQHYDLEQIDESAVFCSCYETTAEGFSYDWVPYTEIRDVLNEKDIVFMKYEDADHFFLDYVFAMTEWYDTALIDTYAARDPASAFGWRPDNLEIAEVLPSISRDEQTASTDSYSLADGTMSPSEAAALADASMQSGFCELPDFLSAQVVTITPYQLNSGTYGYFCRSQFCYEGVPLSLAPIGEILDSNDERFADDAVDEEGKLHSLYIGDAQSFILSQDGICWAWVCNTFDACQVLEIYDNFLTLDTALSRASEIVADAGVSFTISSAKLLYATEMIYEDSDAEEDGGDYVVELFPVWELVVENPPANEYQSLTFYVDAITGTVTLYGLEV